LKSRKTVLANDKPVPETSAMMDVAEDDMEEETKDDNQSSDDEMDEESGALSDIQDDLDRKIPDYVPEFFMDAYRRGKMPATFMDLFTFQIFIVQPQVSRRWQCIFSLLKLTKINVFRKKIFPSERAPASSAYRCSAT
jgi:hypothetical protein